MKQNFDLCFAETLRWEGGARFTNNPRDPGGPTKYGVTIATLSHELGRQATVADVINMTYDTAATIARKRYWNTIGGDNLPAGVDMEAFDIAYNSGPGRVLPWLYRPVNENTLDWIHFLHIRRMSFWRRLRAWAYFHAGWTNRENDVYAHALRLARTGVEA